MLETFALAGGLFAFLTFIHFFADWFFQSHFEATNKHKNAFVRARHCIVYTLAFVPALLMMQVTTFVLIASLLILFSSHFIIDTYIPVYLWAKYLRKMPSLQENFSNKEQSIAAFAELWRTNSVNPILFIAIDQILHLAFLWPVVMLLII